jgi:hypothetical protein
MDMDMDMDMGMGMGAFGSCQEPYQITQYLHCENPLPCHAQLTLVTD